MSDLVYDIFGNGFLYDFAEAVEDIRLRDWLFLLLLLPVSLWAAKQVGLNKIVAQNWARGAIVGSSAVSAIAKAIKDPGIQCLFLFFVLLPVAIIALFLFTKEEPKAPQELYPGEKIQTTRAVNKIFGL